MSEKQNTYQASEESVSQVNEFMWSLLKSRSLEMEMVFSLFLLQKVLSLDMKHILLWLVVNFSVKFTKIVKNSYLYEFPNN